MKLVRVNSVAGIEYVNLDAISFVHVDEEQITIAYTASQSDNPAGITILENQQAHEFLSLLDKILYKDLSDIDKPVITYTTLHCDCGWYGIKPPSGVCPECGSDHMFFRPAI